MNSIIIHLDVTISCIRDENNEITVPRDIYDDACVNDAKKGVEVSVTLYLTCVTLKTNETYSVID
jgi:hypothetical protein